MKTVHIEADRYDMVESSESAPSQLHQLNELHNRFDFELFCDTAPMHFNGFRADRELFGYLLREFSFE